MAMNAGKCPLLPWMIDFHSDKEGVPHCQLKAAFADTRTDYLSELNVESQIPRRKLTGIICTLGPSCDDCKILENMMDHGMTMLVVKMCHCTDEECHHPFKLIHEANDNYSKKIGRVYPLAVAIDIRGPDIRTGSFKNPELQEIQLEQGNLVCLTSDPAYEEHVTEEMIYVDFQDLSEVVEPGDHLFLGHSGIRLSALEIVGSVLRCIVENAGTLMNYSSVSLPGIAIDVPPISERDKRDIIYGMENKVDAFFLSGVRDEKLIVHAREILGTECPNIMLISKVDNPQAICYIDEIIKKSDGILIDRGALSTELEYQKIFLAQKAIIAKCNKHCLHLKEKFTNQTVVTINIVSLNQIHGCDIQDVWKELCHNFGDCKAAGKPVFCCNQVLESMAKTNLPLNSEVSDIANAIIDGCDSFVLTNETVIGEYPVKTVETLGSICKEAEAAVHQKQIFSDLSSKVLTPIEPIYAVSISAVEASLKCNASAIIVLTTSGRSASILAQYRPRCPILAITRYLHVAKKIQLFRGIDPIFYIHKPRLNWTEDVNERIQLGITWGKVSGIIRAGDALVLVNGSRPGSGFTNLMKVVYASDFDALVPEKPNKKKSSPVKEKITGCPPPLRHH